MGCVEGNRCRARRHTPEAGFGDKAARFAALANWATRDLSLARLVDRHVDALAILEEAGHEPDPSATYGVWAARQSAGGTTARLTTDGWCLTGEKPFCSGTPRFDRALVTAECDDGYRLFDVSVAESVTAVHAGSWPAIGMAESLSETLDFGGPPVPMSCAIGPPNFYLERQGFWFGATGVAACWYGGARGLVQEVLCSIGEDPPELVLVELGHAVAHIDLMRRAIDSAAQKLMTTPSTVRAMRSDGPLSYVTRCTTQHSKCWCMPRRPGELGPFASMRRRPNGWPICMSTSLSTTARRMPTSWATWHPKSAHGASRRRYASRDRRESMARVETTYGAPTPATDAPPPPRCRGTASR